MKNYKFSLSTFLLTLIFLSSKIFAQEIAFEATVEKDFMMDGISCLVLNITDGPLKGKKETAYFRTRMTDDFISNNNSALGMGMPVEMQLEESGFKAIKVKGTLLKTTAIFEDYQTGAEKKSIVLRIKELTQVEPPFYTDGPVVSEEEYEDMSNVLNIWVGTYQNSQGARLVIKQSEMDFGPNWMGIDYELVFSDNSPCGEFSGTLNIEAEKTSMVNDEMPLMEFTKKSDNITITNIMAGMDCMRIMDPVFTPKK
jgi:hypothetical protein